MPFLLLHMHMNTALHPVSCFNTCRCQPYFRQLMQAVESQTFDLLTLHHKRGLSLSHLWTDCYLTRHNTWPARLYSGCMQHALRISRNAVSMQT